MTWFKLTVQRHDDQRTAHVRVSGALDLSGACDFDDALRRVERDRPQRLVLDLSALEFLDSAGLARILALRRRCRRAQRQLVLVDGPPVVQRLFGLAGLTGDVDLVSQAS
jgi:anti-anti-sigma factor